MDSEFWKRVEQLFESARKLQAGEREEFLRQACGGDEALRGKVESLLGAAGKAENFLILPALGEEFHVPAPPPREDPAHLLLGRILRKS